MNESVFHLPIQHLDSRKIHRLPENVSTDLELTHSPSVSMYEHLFKPTHEFGRKMISEWGKQFTTDTAFLTESQNVVKEHGLFIEKTKDKACDSAECESVMHIWKSLKEDPRFLDKYAYMEWNMLKHLNESPVFLQCMSFVHLLSPITTVIVPILSLLVPFILLKLKGIPIDFTTYVSVLKDIAKHNFVGKTILSLQNMTNANFIYVLMTIAFYCVQMYNNVTSFFKYYRNVVQVNEHLCSMKQYVEKTLAKMETFDSLHREKASYTTFCSIMRGHTDVLRRLHKELECVNAFSMSVSTAFNIGYMMKCYYSLYTDTEYEKSLLYSMGFEGYIDNLNGVYHHYSEGNMGFATYDNARDTLIEEGFYPAYSGDDTCVKNNCHLDKNMIITGVNASGKTTMLKTTTLNILFSQQLGLGFYKNMNLKRPYTHIHSYLNIPDTSGRDSLFQAEARRCKDILDTIRRSGEDAHHFCIFDELYSGTNPIEATKSAYAFLVYLSTIPNVNFMLTTHYTSICKKCKATGRIRNYKMDVEKGDNDEFLYTYLMKVGICYLEGGVEILRAMDYPEEIIQTIRDYDTKPTEDSSSEKQ